MAVLFLWILSVCLCTSVSAEGQEIITAKPGQDVTLTCRAPNNNIPIIVVEWSRADLDKEYVLLYRDGKLYLGDQHPSFKDRVDLQDRRMKDGNVSLILNNVTTEDRGTYECRVVQRGTNRRKRGLKTSTFILLEVIEPGPEERRGEKEGGGEGGNSRGQHGLIVPVVGIIMTAAVVAAAAGLISQRHKKKKSDSPPDEAAVQQLV